MNSSDRRSEAFRFSKLVRIGEIRAMAAQGKAVGKGTPCSEKASKRMKEEAATDTVSSESSQKMAPAKADLVALLKQFQETFLVSPAKESGGSNLVAQPRGELNEEKRGKPRNCSSHSGAGSPWPATQRAARSGGVQAPSGMPEIQRHWQEIVDLYHRTRKILHESMYMDGARLSPEDEMAVRKILKYHLKSEEKTGPGIDYIKINQIYDENTRCLWVVRVDGTEIDFSYHKCLKVKAANECPNLLEHFGSLHKGLKPRLRDYTRRNGACTRF